MKIANVQMQMHNSVEDNLKSMLRYIDEAADIGVKLIAFPELSVTGCHREIRRACDELRSSFNWVERISATCRRNRIFAFVGAPTFSDEAILDSYTLFDESGEIIGVSHKVGLTPSEQTFFAKGERRKVWNVCDLKIGIVICREIADLPELLEEMGAAVDLLLWPCFSGVYETLPEGTDQVSLEQAQLVAGQFGARLIQANWANSLNRPELKEIGGSVYISNRGKKLATAPLGEPGFGVINTGEDSFDWYGRNDA
ncbi:MAG: carbon-nitrogen hydrolase family protein [Pseudomonadales bacterium]|nr:carbon-nitrogen hydrolase family protein [Pseudomonadales bacterium]